MGAFFVGWELWEDLTFVLACCIVLVFVFGFARLWWTNRRIERLELVDEERRVRLAEMRYCGIDARGITDIPFGVRAIQSGIEVDGIWISKPNTPVTSGAASSSTLIGDVRAFKGKGKMVDQSFNVKQPTHLSVEVVESATQSPQTLATSGYSTPLPIDELDLNQGRISHTPSEAVAYVSSGLGFTERNLKSHDYSANRASTATSMQELIHHSSGGTIPTNSGTEEPYFNVFPQATWDQGYSSSDVDTQNAAPQQRRSRRGRLQKKHHPYMRS